MSAVLKIVDAGDTAPSRQIAWLAEAVARNRFMPVPPVDRIFIGDGDFKAIGAEFLRHLVELGGLKPDARFLDIGSGIGRLAIPLTQYLDPERASYDGVDPVQSGVDWCTANITLVYPRFRFQHLDIRNEIYNPGGIVDGLTLNLPFGDQSIDFAAMISVVTHLPADEVRRYAAEVARVLVSGGTLLLTAFVIGRTDRRPSSSAPRLEFARAGSSPEWHADPDHPLAAVAFDDGFLESVMGDAGLTLRRKVPGNWSGHSAAHFQDILVIEKMRSAA